MMKHSNPFDIIGWLFGLALMCIGVLNLILVHPVPGTVYLFLSVIFLPPTNIILKKGLGFSIPAGMKIILGIIIVWFTLGISDLAEMYGL